MALTPINENHALQIQAGTLGRKTGHDFEGAIAREISALQFPYTVRPSTGHVATADPAMLLLNFVATREGFGVISKAVAISTGALATSEAGKSWLAVNGVPVSRCKSDLILTMMTESKNEDNWRFNEQCNNPKPTNAQLYFTTGVGFSNLLRSNGIHVSLAAEQSLRQFCGDVGFRPLDQTATTRG